MHGRARLGGRLGQPTKTLIPAKESGVLTAARVQTYLDRVHGDPDFK